jgi:hypothetical protein
MSNGSSVGPLNNAAAANNAATAEAGGFMAQLSVDVAAVQPYAALVVALIALANDLIQFNEPDPTTTMLDEINTELSLVFQQLNATDAGNTILARNSTVKSYLAEKALTALANLQGSLNNPTMYLPGDQITLCVKTLNDFKDYDTYAWNTTYSSEDFQEIYWTDVGLFQNTCKYEISGGGTFNASNDAGYGKRPPPKNPDGATVFEYRYSLPIYLYAVSIFLAVGGALDPNFLANQRPELGWIVSTLHRTHDKIKSGLTTLSPPDWTNAGLKETVCFNVNRSGPPGIRLIYDGANPDSVTGGMMEYGAVERFSGFSSIGSTYRITLNGDPGDSNPALFNKLQVRLLKRLQDVYAAVGLVNVWQTINQLSALLAQPAMPKATFTWPDGSVPYVDLTDWSFRQIIGLAKLAPVTNGLSLRALGGLIIGTQPFDTPYSPGATSFSFRTLLSNFSD